MTVRTWTTGTAGSSSLADLGAAFQQQAEQLAELADTITAAFAPDQGTLDALADLARAVRTASSNPRRLRSLLRHLEQRRNALHTGLAAVADAVTGLLGTGWALLAALTHLQRCPRRTSTVAAHRSTPIATHLAAHAPPAGVCFSLPTTCPGVP